MSMPVSCASSACTLFFRPTSLRDEGSSPRDGVGKALMLDAAAQNGANSSTLSNLTFCLLPPLRLQPPPQFTSRSGRLPSHSQVTCTSSHQRGFHLHKNLTGPLQNMMLGFRNRLVTLVTSLSFWSTSDSSPWFFGPSSHC